MLCVSALDVNYDCPALLSKGIQVEVSECAVRIFFMFRGGAKPMELKFRAVLYCIVLYCIVLYRIVLYRIVSYCIVLYRIVLYRIVSLMNNFVSLRSLRNYQTKPMNVFRYKRDAE